MFQYEYEKPRRPISVLSCDSRATMTTDWSRVWPSTGGNTRPTDSCRSSARALPSQPAVLCRQNHIKPGVPLKVWIIASASCFAVCAILVLATVAITKWGTSDTFADSNRYYAESNPSYTSPKSPAKLLKTTKAPIIDNDLSEENTIDPILEKISLLKNIAKKDGLLNKPQYHPEHDIGMHHLDRKIEKKDQPKVTVEKKKKSEAKIPEFKPTLPDIFVKHEIKLPNGFTAGFRKDDVDLYDDYYYNDENLYEDYIQSTSMTSYLIEKVQELHDWISNDSEFEYNNKTNTSNEFSQVLKALNYSIVEGNITIIMKKLKDIYYNDNINYTINAEKKIILTNKTDLFSFGILTLDVMLLHNIQLMAWENQENIRNKMLKDPDVFAFNALFMDPAKVEAKQNEIFNNYEPSNYGKRQNMRTEQMDDDDATGKNVIESVMELGMSAARAVIHLGRAYKNTKTVLTQISNRDQLQASIQTQVAKNIVPNTHALKHLQTSYVKNDSLVDVASLNDNMFYTELDCVWLLYCRNLAATAKLTRPYGVMARINGVALRMLSGELSAEKAVDTLLYEALTGWTDLRCNDMFPRCSNTNASKVVLDTIVQPTKKTTKVN